MIIRFLKLSLFLTSFLFLTGFVPLPAVLGPAITVATSGNLAKATAQLVFDNEFKKKTGKSSLGYITEEVSKNNKENQINEDFKNLIEKRVEIVHQKLVEQNNESKIITNSNAKYSKGSMVIHKKFGQGKVESVDGKKLTINFGESGTRKVMENFVESLN